MKWVCHGWAMLAAVIVLILMSSPRAVRAAEIGRVLLVLVVRAQRAGLLPVGDPAIRDG